MRSYYLKSKELGSIVESLFRSLPYKGSKRKSAQAFKKLAALLHTLKLVPQEEPIVALGYGLNISGEVGIVAVTDTVKIEGSIQP